MRTLNNSNDSELLFITSFIAYSPFNFFLFFNNVLLNLTYWYNTNINYNIFLSFNLLSKMYLLKNLSLYSSTVLKLCCFFQFTIIKYNFYYYTVNFFLTICTIHSGIVRITVSLYSLEQLSDNVSCFNNATVWFD